MQSCPQYAGGVPETLSLPSGLSLATDWPPRALLPFALRPGSQTGLRPPTLCCTHKPSFGMLSHSAPHNPQAPGPPSQYALRPLSWHSWKAYDARRKKAGEGGRKAHGKHSKVSSLATAELLLATSQPLPRHILNHHSSTSSGTRCQSFVLTEHSVLWAGLPATMSATHSGRPPRPPCRI